MSRFSGEGAQTYDGRMERLIPGYSLVALLSAAYFKTCLPDDAHILVVGAGTCEEVVTLANAHPKWRFTATDISPDMLALGEQKIQKYGLGNRVRLLCGTVGQVIDAKSMFDAATVLWVMHFIEFAQKADFLQEISNVLKLSAPFVIADLMKMGETLYTDIQVETCRLMGLPDERVDVMKTRYQNDFYPLAYDDLDGLCNNVGLALNGVLFQSPRFQCCFG